MIKVTVPGQKDPAGQVRGEVGGIPLGELGALGVSVAVNDAVRVSAARSDEAPKELSLADDEVVEVTLEGGVRLFVRGDELAERLGGAAKRSPTRPGTIELSPNLPLEERQRGGPATWAINGLRLLGIDLPQAGAKAVAKQIDERRAPAPGLYRWTEAGQLERLSSALQPASDAWLLFLHGTFSNTAGSFGTLPLGDNRRHWQELRERYGNRVLAFDHYTLTESPVANAIRLLEELPGKAALHLVTHSRGGLIGELLCRSGLVDAAGTAINEPFDETDFNLFVSDQRTELQKLAGLLKAKRPTIERFVRVACPARGTTLASARLDRWLNMALEVAGIGAGVVPGLGATFEAMQAFLLAVVKERTDPRSIPGLEAMIPDSALIRVLNRLGRSCNADLSIVKGDSAGSGALRRLAIWLADVFFGEDHDLVVNTSSMIGGTARTKAREFFDQGASVDHFRYFANARTSERIVAGLLRAEDDTAGFGELAAAAASSMPKLRSRANDRRPIAYILPGIAGSHLKVGSDRVWISLLRIASGGLSRIEIDDPAVTADEPIGLYYGDLAKHLDATHEVRPWAYDWRRSILELGSAFGTELRGALDSSRDRPVRIVAHSMGGLIARAALMDPDTLSRFQGRDGCRLIMLGTPNGGSFSIPFMFLGRNKTMRYIQALDLTRGLKEHLGIISRWSGAIEMLPDGGALDLFDHKNWRDLKNADPGDLHWPGPTEEDLLKAKAFRTRFATAPIDPERMFYISGQALTLDGVVVDPSAPKGSRIRFSQTHRGDGQVLWETGHLRGVRTWYTDAMHGDLARHQPAFPAIVDLLEHGSTSRLPDQPPARLRGQPAPQPIVREEAPIFPSEDDLIDAAMGGVPQREARPSLPRIKVSVVHGNIAFVDHPVLVGHYTADAIAGAEAQLDRALKGRLSERRRLGLYPGPIGTSTVSLDMGARPKGAVVVGLGDAGSLAPGLLRTAVRQGLLAYAAAEQERPLRAGEGAPESLAISALVIGSGEAGLPRAGCLQATLQAAAEAQQILAAQPRAAETGRPLLFARLQLCELLEYRAFEIWHALDELLGTRPKLAEAFELDGTVSRRPGALRRLAGTQDADWWQPLQITMEVDDLTRKRTVVFVNSAGRARVEASLLDANFDFAERFIRQAIAGATGGQAGATPSRALFELLWPVQLKGHSGEDRNLRLILDEHTAAVPWELMDDRRPVADDGSPSSGSADHPPAVRFSVVRQLTQDQFRETVVPARQRSALVIGDPLGEASGFLELPGAQQEARSVAQLLRTQGFQVTELIGLGVKPEDVVMHLLGQAWEIVHVAAHGVVDWAEKDGDPKQTGIVLGGGLVLGPSVFSNMTITPSLFFVNCCHLGRVDPKAEDKRREEALRSRRPDFAASVAVGLIRLGAKGVIAAGWAVDDLAAEQFAVSFYSGFLGGKSFRRGGKARSGRSLRGEQPGNHLGAYQCYGEPDWRLDQGVAATVVREPIRYASPVEIVAAAEAIREQLQVGLIRDVSEQRRQLADLEDKAKRTRWLDRPDIRLALAEAYAETGDLAHAIDHYQAAIADGKMGASIKAIEQWANLKSRCALIELHANMGAASAQKDAVEAIDKARQRVEGLAQLCGASAERWALVGGCWKRTAQCANGDGRATALEKMREAYAEAAKMSGLDSRFYPELMVAAANIAIAKLNGGAVPARVRKAVKDIRAAGGSHLDFWRDIAVADACLLQAVIDGMVANERELGDAYRNPWRHGGSPLKLMSTLDQMVFFEDVLTGSAVPPMLLAAIARLRTSLEAELRGA